MLRRLATLAVRSSSRSIFTNRPQFSVGRRSIHPSKDLWPTPCARSIDVSNLKSLVIPRLTKEDVKFARAVIWFLTGSALGVAVKLGAEQYLVERRKWDRNIENYYQRILIPTTESDTLLKGFFEEGRSMFSIGITSKGWFQRSLTASINIKDIRFATEFNEICEGLEEKGIHVERSEAGARKGLIQYAARQLCDCLKEESEKSVFTANYFADAKDFGTRALPGTVASIVATAVGTALLTGAWSLAMPAGVLCGGLWALQAETFGYGAYHDKKYPLTGSPFREDVKSASEKKWEAFGPDCDQKHQTSLLDSSKNDENQNGFVLFRFPLIKLRDSNLKDNTDISVGASVEFELAGWFPTWEEIYDGLKRCGIGTEHSEEGVRNGLMQFALKQMYEGLEKHPEKTCQCNDLSESEATV